MLEKNEQSDRALNTSEKPESCYCSALPKGVRPVCILLYEMAGREAFASKALRICPRQR
jgi:hypothetical protein